MNGDLVLSTLYTVIDSTLLHCTTVDRLIIGNNVPPSTAGECEGPVTWMWIQLRIGPYRQIKTSHDFPFDFRRRVKREYVYQYVKDLGLLHSDCYPTPHLQEASIALYCQLGQSVIAEPLNIFIHSQCEWAQKVFLSSLFFLRIL